ncbi:MAG TPA: hypothetical protein VKG63_01010 [Steroidobacteraceae bacterium]|nr:hypothetical protein [Steroidobacteraceae bacterium]
MSINRSEAPSSVAGIRPRGWLLFAILLTTGEIFPALAQEPTPQSLRTGPLIPSAILRPPFPPPQEGCRYLKEGKWLEVPCATDEELRRQRLPVPSMDNAIQSNPHSVFILDNHSSSSYTTPIIWGSVSIVFLSDPRDAAETDGNSNAFSLQTNTNYFHCATCSSGYPFAAIPGISQSASQPGDVGWVQFTYQNFGNSTAQLCIFQIDITINVHTNGAYLSGANGGFANANEAGFHKDCVAHLPVTAPLTGRGAVVARSDENPAVGGAEVIGYITCPHTGCLLQLVAYLPWAGRNWWSITKKDVLGLNGNWINVNGSILGSGGNSTAVFSSTSSKTPKVTIEQAVRAFSCVTFSSATGYMPEPCPAPILPIERFFDLSATPTFSPYTGEKNNLTSGPVTFTCGPTNCTLLFDSTAP